MKQARGKQGATPLFSESDQLAARDVGIELTSDYLKKVRGKIKEKETLEAPVQYQVIIDGAKWSIDEIDDRIFVAVRLLHEYLGPAGKQLNGSSGAHSERLRTRDPRQDRIRELKDLVLRLGIEKAKGMGLIDPATAEEQLKQIGEHLPIVRKIINDELILRSSKRDRAAG